MALKDHEIAQLINETTQDLRQKISKPHPYLRQIVSVAIVDSLKKMNARSDHRGTSMFLCHEHDGIGFVTDCRVCKKA